MANKIKSVFEDITTPFQPIVTQNNISENGKIYEAGSSVKEINDKKIRITLSDGKYDIKILND